MPAAAIGSVLALLPLECAMPEKSEKSYHILVCAPMFSVLTIHMLCGLCQRRVTLKNIW